MAKLNNKGFSLVELMVVVAIIGILSSIAIPSINKYMAKARQSEAKSNLASIYTANKALYAEFRFYDNRFSVIGYNPEGRLRYNIGWAAAAGNCGAAAALNTNYNYSGAVLGPTNTVAFCPTSNGACTVLADGQQAITGSGMVCAANMTFTAGARGRISSSANTDSWIIDHNKTLTNPVDGTQ